MTMQEMVTTYNKLSAAHKYIVGFVRHGKVYYITVCFAELEKFLKLDHASSKRGGHAKLRVMVSSMQAMELVASGRAIELCDVEELTKCGGNRGHNFERIITELMTDQIWTRDSIPFYVQGDINVNGEEIQIKLSTAELTNEKTLTRALETLAA